MGLELGTLRSRVICPTNWTSPRHPSFLPILSITVVVTFPKQWFLKVTPLYQKNLQRLPAIHKTVQNAEMRIQGSRAASAEKTLSSGIPQHIHRTYVIFQILPNSPMHISLFTPFSEPGRPFFLSNLSLRPPGQD